MLWVYILYYFFETTGGKFNEEGITEIAVYKFNGHTVVDQFISLINPEKKRIVEITQDCTLVAHNASFDYRILRTEFNRLGFNFDRNTLCTVALSKKLILDQPSYSLGKLVKSLGIPITNRHRASGDALATVQLFKLLLEKDVSKTIVQNSIKYFDNRIAKKKLLKILESVPSVFGVFYVHNENGKVIYIGKGKNIKAELNILFLKETKRAQKIQDRVVSVSYDKTGNELFTRLKYESELEILIPKYNIRKKRKQTNLDFNHDNFIIIDKGREIEENAIILVEENEIFGYGFTNLAFQETQLDILKSILTPLKNKKLSKSITKKFLQKNKVQKIIRL